jgi:DNA-binding transcriptional LysR family regulator
LNLLLTLNALLIERNVTRAAARLHLSQPSVSVQLGKLRAAFDDPLLLPGPRGMLPTARALALLAPQAVLAQLELVLQPEAAFDQATAGALESGGRRRNMRSCCPCCRPARAGALRMAVFEAVPARMAQDLEAGQVDLGFWRRKKRRPACATAPCSGTTCWRAATATRCCSRRPASTGSARWNSSSSRPTAAVSAARSMRRWNSWGTRQVVLSVPHS